MTVLDRENNLHIPRMTSSLECFKTRRTRIFEMLIVGIVKMANTMKSIISIAYSLAWCSNDWRWIMRFLFIYGFTITTHLTKCLIFFCLNKAFSKRLSV